MSGATLKSMIVSGEIASTDLVWREGMADWSPAATINDFESAGVVESAGIVAPPGGSQIPQGGVPQPGQVPGTPVAHAPISNYLVPAILVTIFCCWPFGIPAIVFAPPAILAFAEARKGATLEGKPFDLCFAPTSRTC